MVPVSVRVRTGLGLILAATTLLPGGCSLSPGAGEGRATQAPCQPSGAALDLGAHAFDVAPQDHVKVSGGRYLLTATGFVHGGPFDPEVGRTKVVWGPKETPPRYDAGSATATGASGAADVVEDEPAVVDLEEGTWWFLNSNAAQLTLQACAPATAELVPQR